MRLFSKIVNKDNFDLAVEKLKKNGSENKATGVDGTKLSTLTNDKSTYNRIRERLQNRFKPLPVKRVEIPKPDGKKRPLGIPCMEDRIIQMMFKNILEPICEKQFYHYSYGFRPNRSAEHAKARCDTLINRGKNYFCVDIDIKGFFDNINHKKLIKQCIATGIKDMKVISIIKEMLRAPIVHPNGHIQIPTKGTPQGGILSPLLANICLNELDWWIDRQWIGMKTQKKYSTNNSMQGQLRKYTNLTEVKIVRYADDFKLFCKNRDSVERMFKITKIFLKNRLKLDISKEKSKTINLRKQSSIFLGFKIKAVRKGKKVIAKSNISDKAKKAITFKLKKTVKEIQKDKDVLGLGLKYNSQVRGIQNYYRIATNCSKDFGEIGFLINKTLYNRLGKPHKIKAKISKAYQERYKGYHCRVWNVKEISLFSIRSQKHKKPMQYSEKKIKKQNETKLLKENYENIYLSSGEIGDVKWNLLKSQVYYEEKGKCYVSGEFLGQHDFEVHHIVPRKHGGLDELSNLILLKKEIHKQLHMTNPTIDTNYYPKFTELRNIILSSKVNK